MSNQPSHPGRLGILVGGGPAPGINGVIGAATIEAIQNGIEVIGIQNGFRWLVKGDASHTRKLTIPDVSRIHFEGGSVLGTSRANPVREENGLVNTVKALKELNIQSLVTIGGDDTAFSAREVCNAAGGAVRVAHVPKTIDNDLPLPGNVPTFGFQTARHVGVSLVRNLMVDSLTTGRWYFVVAMGRKAGHLALGIGKAASATLTVIGEEFGNDELSVDEVVDILEGAIIKRLAAGREDGVAVVAEGVVEKIKEEELASIPGVKVEYDDHGHLRLAEIPFAGVLKDLVSQRLKERGIKLTIVDVNIGYELRCAPPVPFDCEYVRDLGYGAVRYLLSADKPKGTELGALVCLDGGKLRPIPFDDLRDPETGKTSVRLVDIDTESYEVARNYMIRLHASDLEDEAKVERLAEAAKMDVDSFKARFANIR